MEHAIAFVSDLDGTLVDTTHLYYEAYVITFKKWDIEFSEAIYRQNRHKTLKQWLLDLQIHPLIVDQILDDYKDCLNQLLETAQWLPGVPEFLTVLGDARVACGLVTLARGTSIDVMHKRLDVRSRFRAVIDREHVGTRRKPDPFGIREALRLLGKQQGIMLGDEPVDARAGNDAGVKTYHIRSKHTPEHDHSLWTGGIIQEHRELLHVWGLRDTGQSA